MSDPHNTLNLVGAMPVPLLDEGADGVNAILYFIEGDNAAAYESSPLLVTDESISFQLQFLSCWNVA